MFVHYAIVVLDFVTLTMSAAAVVYYSSRSIPWRLLCNAREHCFGQHLFMGGLGQSTLTYATGFFGSLMAAAPSSVTSRLPVHAHSKALACPIIACPGLFDCSLPEQSALKSSTTVTSLDNGTYYHYGDWVTLRRSQETNHEDANDLK